MPIYVTKGHNSREEIMKKLTEARRKEAVKELSILYGIPPYDGPENICLADGYFAKSIESRFHTTIKRLVRVTGFDIRMMEWQHIKKNFEVEKRKIDGPSRLL